MLKVMVGSKLAMPKAPLTRGAPWLQTKTLILSSAMHKNSEPNERTMSLSSTNDPKLDALTLDIWMII